MLTNVLNNLVKVDMFSHFGVLILLRNNHAYDLKNILNYFKSYKNKIIQPSYKIKFLYYINIQQYNNIKFY